MPDVPAMDDDPQVQRTKARVNIGITFAAAAAFGVSHLTGYSPEATAAAVATIGVPLRSALTTRGRLKTLQGPPASFRLLLPGRDFASSPAVAFKPEGGGEPQRRRDDRRQQPDRRGR